MPTGLAKVAIKVAACTALVAGCSAHHTPAPTTPPVFPNFGAYTAVNADDYSVELPSPGRQGPVRLTRFTTPGGTQCDVTSVAAQCGGSTLPGVPVAAPPYEHSAGSGYTLHDGWFSIGTDQPLKAYNTDPGDTGKVKTLPAAHSITVGGKTCGVDGDGAITCLDSASGSGFMLSRAWTGWLAQSSRTSPSPWRQ